MADNLPNLIKSLKDANISFRKKYLESTGAVDEGERENDLKTIRSLEGSLKSALSEKDGALIKDASINESDKSYERVKLNGVMDNCGFNSLAFFVAEAVLNDKDNDGLKEFWEFYKKHASPNNPEGTLKDEIKYLLQLPYTDVNDSAFQNKMGFMLRAFFSSKDKPNANKPKPDLFLDISKDKNETATNPETFEIPRKIHELVTNADRLVFYKGMISDDSIAKMAKFFGIDVDIFARDQQPGQAMTLLFTKSEKSDAELNNFGIVVDYSGKHYDILLPRGSKALELLGNPLNVENSNEPGAKPHVDSLPNPETKDIIPEAPLLTSEENLKPSISPLSINTDETGKDNPVVAKLPLIITKQDVKELLGSTNFSNYHLDEGKSNNDEMVIKYLDKEKEKPNDSSNLEIKVKKQNDESVITFNSDNSNFKEDAFRYVKFVAGIAKKNNITDGVLTINTNNANKALQLIHYANIYNIRVEISDSAKQGLIASKLSETADKLLKVNSDERFCNEYKSVILDTEKVRVENKEIDQLMSFIEENREKPETETVVQSPKNTKFDL